MKLYYTKAACSLVVRIIINELDLTCEYESVDLKSKKTEKGEDFLNVNPKGAVPTLRTNDGDILTENAIILQYLADTNHATQLLAKVGEIKRYHALEWVNYVTTELHKTIGAMFNPMITQEMKDSLFIPLIKTKLNYVNKHLESKNYLYDDHFTLADAYLFVMLNWVQFFKMNVDSWPNLARYHQELKGRKSILKSLQEEGLH